jgi:hypothetical protein
MKLIIIKFSPSLLLLPLSLVQIFSITLFSDNHKLYSSINARDQISHLHRTADTTEVLYMLIIFMFLTSSREEENIPNRVAEKTTCHFFLVGWDLRHQVLRPLLAYCTAPDDR